MFFMFIGGFIGFRLKSLPLKLTKNQTVTPDFTIATIPGE